MTDVAASPDSITETLLNALEANIEPALTTGELSEIVGLSYATALRGLSKLHHRQRVVKTRVVTIPIVITRPVIPRPPFNSYTLARETRWFAASRIEEAVAFRVNREKEALDEYVWRMGKEKCR